uniref:Serine/threonine protein kinase n=1 Tax=Ignisphaera aggregans TaxID=334771 RepID=A0A7C5Z194_9CREN
MLCHSYELSEIPFDIYHKIVCYPNKERLSCLYRIENIKNIGVDKLYSFGKVQIDKYNIIGKGHAAIVVLAKHRVYGIVALKIRRIDSKRTSLEYEAKLLETAYHCGYTPKLYLYTDDFIVREYIDGLTIKEFLDMVYSRENVIELIKHLLLAAYSLDRLGIDIHELSRPYKQVILLCGDPKKPFFIDLESGGYSLRPSNVTRIVNFVIAEGIKRKNIIGDVIKLDDDRIQLLFKLIKIYKNLPPDSKSDLFNRILDVLGVS